jgi:hypothetical protein
MGASRTSNKDVLNAIEGLTSTVDQLVNVLTANAMPSAPAEPEAVVVPTTETPAKPEGVQVDGAYLSHMQGKAADHATAKGSDVVLYARRNKMGQTKLAYALKERYQTVIARQPSTLGALHEYHPAS